jgi:hypothetical protein
MVINGRLKKVAVALIVGLAIVSFWRGAWQLMDVYLFPSSYVLSNAISLVVGFVVLVFMHRAVKVWL